MTETVITIDGPAGSGKSTVSRLLARRLRFLYLDTGAMYRAVALAAKRREVRPDDGRALGELCRQLDLRFDSSCDPPRLHLWGEDVTEAIRTREMDMLSSRVSKVKEVREAMTALQRKMAHGQNLVAEGRDMGTMVFPEAKYKFFLAATPEIRAERRYKERLEQGQSVSREGVLTEMQRRDHQDESRSLAPMRAAKDAKTIDTSAMSPEAVVDEMMSHLHLEWPQDQEED